MLSPVELSRMDGLGNVVRFSCGRVSVTVPGVSLHLNEDAFVLFAAMVAQAKAAYMDARLRDMVREEGEI